jgi:hypothetical protein
MYDSVQAASFVGRPDIIIFTITTSFPLQVWRPVLEINVKLPDTFPTVPACAGSPIGAFTIYSNLTINITDGFPINPSSDGVPICVLPQQ